MQYRTRVVSTCDMSETKNTELRLLIKTVTTALEKYNVTYWIDYGTVLGAYRYCDVIPWDHDADIGYLETDYKKVVRAAEEVNTLRGFKMNSLISNYKNHTLDLFRWKKVKNWWSVHTLFNFISGKNDTSDNYIMYVVMPRDNSILIFIRNFFFEYFPYKFLNNRSRVKLAHFEVFTLRNITELVQWRYFLTYNNAIPYNIDCLSTLDFHNSKFKSKTVCHDVVI